MICYNPNIMTQFELLEDIPFLKHNNSREPGIRSQIFVSFRMPVVSHHIFSPIPGNCPPGTVKIPTDH